MRKTASNVFYTARVMLHGEHCSMLRDVWRGCVEGSVRESDDQFKTCNQSSTHTV